MSASLTNLQMLETTPHPRAEKITKLIRQTFFPVIIDFRLPIFPVIAPN